MRAKLDDHCHSDPASAGEVHAVEDSSLWWQMLRDASLTLSMTRIHTRLISL